MKSLEALHVAGIDKNIQVLGGGDLNNDESNWLATVKNEFNP